MPDFVLMINLVICKILEISDEKNINNDAKSKSAQIYCITYIDLADSVKENLS